MANIFFIIIGINIGINIGMAFGWVLSKKFGGDMEKLMKWLEAT